MIDKQKLIRLFKNISILLEIKGEIAFKINAYKNIADILSNDDLNIEHHIKNNSLTTINGIGKAISEKIIEFYNTGEIEFYNKLIQEFPEELIEITKIAKIGAKKTAQIYKKLGITSIESLEKACLNNEISAIKGFGEKTQENILVGISHKKASKGRFLQTEIINDANKIIELLRNNHKISKVELCGDFRRKSEIIEKVIIIAQTNFNLLETVQDLENVNPLIQNINDNYIKSQLKINDNFNIDFYLTNEISFYILLNYLSSSDEFNSAFTALLNSINFEIKEYCLYKNNNLINISSEENLYDIADLQFIPPELRENEEAIIKARNQNIPQLIENKDLKGILHLHTNWSDGKNSIKEMAIKAKELGFEYIGISDHSKSSVYTNGLTPARVLLQHQEIDELNKQNLGIVILKGIESDILPDGSLDYDDEILQKFDFVVASVHSSFSMNEKHMTNRIIKAIENQYTMILGHPTGRLLLSREPYKVNINKIIDAAAANNKIIELNANPYRLDLSWQNIILAKEKGVKISINPDSHKTSTLSDIFIGVGIARKGWLEKNNVLNTLSKNEFFEFLNDFKKRWK